MRVLVRKIRPSTTAIVVLPRLNVLAKTLTSPRLAIISALISAASFLSMFVFVSLFTPFFGSA